MIFDHFNRLAFVSHEGFAHAAVDKSALVCVVVRIPIHFMRSTVNCTDAQLGREMRFDLARNV